MKEISNSCNNNPLVSIICITYNQEEYISDCINGFIMQKTDFPFEVLIHDDASTDRTLDIVLSYQKKYPFLIRVFTEDENQYLKTDITHTMVNLSRGDYIAFCEGDDYWIDPFKLKRQIDLFGKNPGMTLCFSNRIILDERNNNKRLFCWKQRIYRLEDFMSGFNPGVQTECLLKRSLSDKDLEFGFFNHINGDRTIPISSAMKGFAMNVPVATAVYRVTGKGVSTSISANNTAVYWFNHATDDLYHLHEAYGFPNCKAYVKSITAYTFNFIRKTGRIFYGINKVSHYGDKSRIRLILKVCCAEIMYLFGRLCCYTKLYWSKLLRFFSMRFISHQFSVLVFECLDDYFDLGKMRRIKAIKTPVLNIGNKAVTKADAFLYSNEKELRVYYELQDSFNAKGVVMMIKTEDGKHWTRPEVALEENFHLSFPNVFCMDGKIWMIPETFMANQVRLYEEQSETGRFELKNVLLEGGKYVDSFVYKNKDVYYLFTSIQYADQSYDLKLFYSDDFTGGYVEHPMSPISHGKAYQRNAGHMIEYAGHIFRPAQECTAYYGQNVHIMEIVELTKTVYKEVPYKLDIIPKGKGFGIGGHQYCICDYKGKKYVAIDILHYALNVNKIWNRFINKIILK